MPRAFPPEFRQKAVELAPERAKPARQIAEDLALRSQCLLSSPAENDH
jgi:transposase-like protein